MWRIGGKSHIAVNSTGLGPANSRRVSLPIVVDAPEGWQTVAVPTSRKPRADYAQGSRFR